MVVGMHREGLPNEIIARIAGQTPQVIAGWIREAGMKPGFAVGATFQAL